MDFTKAWPFGLDSRRWWLSVVIYLAVLAAVLPFDEAIVAWAHAQSPAVLDFFGWVTSFGDSGWVLYPAIILFVITAALARFAPQKLMRLALTQLATLYGFIFLGVGLPGLITNVVKHIIGRGRPVHFGDVGLWGLRPNWVDWSYQSMPSGHTTTAFALAFVVGFLSRRLGLLMLVVAFGVAVSRVVLAAHYPTDTIVGAAVGTLGAHAVRWWFARLGLLFVRTPDGSIRLRGTAAVTRLLQLRRRGTARGRRQDRL